MRTESIINDFPKNKLKSLILNANTILILQPPDLSLSIASETLSAALGKVLAQLKADNQVETVPSIILCTKYPEVFGNNPDITKILAHGEYKQFLISHRSKKENLLIIDISCDAGSTFLFEFDRMTKWPVSQKPYLSKITFHWQNLPQSKGESNCLSNRYLLLIEDILGKQIFVKPRFPKLYLPDNQIEIYECLKEKHLFTPEKLRQVAFVYSLENPTQKINPLLLSTLMESLSKKKRKLEITILIDVIFKDEPWFSKLQELGTKKQGFSLISPRKFNVITIENKQELMVLLSRQELVIGNDCSAIHIANALGVKTISLRGPMSKHFISNFRWDSPIYPDKKICEYLSKTDTWQNKGYMAPCFDKQECLQEVHCVSEINPEVVLKKACELL